MRKWLLCVLVLLCLTVSVSAAETVTLEEAGITLTIPDGYDAAYRGMPEDHPYLTKYGETVESIQERLDSNGSELMALKLSPEISILTVGYYAVEDLDYRMAGGETLACELGVWESVLTEIYQTTVDAQYVPVGDGIYQRFVFGESESFSAMESYETVRNGYRYTISLVIDGGSLTEAHQTQMRQLMESVVFLEEMPEADPVTQVEFYDEACLLKLEHPSDWECRSLMEEELLGLELQSKVDRNASVEIYKTEDWFVADSPQKEQSINMDTFVYNTDEEFLKEWLYQPDTLAVSETVIEGRKYLMCECTYLLEGTEFSYARPLVVLLHMRENTLYEIWYWGTKDDVYFRDVKGILGSLVFLRSNVISNLTPQEPAEEVEQAPAPGLPAEEPVAEEPMAAEPSASKSGSGRAMLIVAICAVAAVAVCVIVAIKKKPQKQDVPSKPEETPPEKVCPSCGKASSISRAFCIYCGSRMN